MPQTPDRHPGNSDEEGTDFETVAGGPTVNGQVRYVSGVGFRFFDEGLSKGLGISEADHKILRQLVHLAEEGGPWDGFASGAFEEQLPSGSAFPTSSIWYTNATKTSKIVQELVTYNANKTINTDQWTVFAADGVTPLLTATDTFTYSGVVMTSRTRVLT
jgi:hypothetical protein